MVYGSSTGKYLIAALVILMIVNLWSGAAAQQDAPDTLLLNEISQDWATDMIFIFIETPNKWDATYGVDYNITSLDVLNEMSAVEETMDPQKDDYGEADNIFFVMSISTLIKEIYVSPRNVAQAISDELEIPVPVEQIPGDYAIPQDQDEIDNIVSQISAEALELFVEDSNRDGIWDTAVIWRAVENPSTGLLDDIDALIDRYRVDMEVDEGHYNSEASWWERVRNEAVHCRMTNLGYTTTYETYDGIGQVLDRTLPIFIMLIIGVLTLIIVIKYNPPKGGIQEKGKKKNTLKVMLVLMMILLAVSFSFIIIETSLSPSPELREFSHGMGGGQMGCVLMRGNPAPSVKDAPTQGGGSMKDIEVLDDMDRLQVRLRDEALASSFCIIDIMKMLRIHNSSNPDVVNQLPEAIRERINDTVSHSFWDAIHLANDDETSIWYLRYGKSQQDSMINIFYNSLTVEMESTFVNVDYSRSLMYIQMPMDDAENSEIMLDSVNSEIDSFPVTHSTSDVVLIGRDTPLSGLLGWMLEVMALFIVLVLGVIIFALTFHRIRRKGKDEDEDIQPFIPDYEIGLKGDYPESYDPYKKNPPSY